ncbi:acyl-CoA N-acyltransferase [Ganoderma leucocontextum]|nr:acyl-CoA N-acyltransferase [Ganoderma leucocontextum]
MKTSRRVQAANKASLDKISSVADTQEPVTISGTEFLLRVERGSGLSSSDRDAIWNLWETNMRAMAEPSSFGWDPPEKKEELFHENSRYILMLHSDSTPLVEETGLRIVAFTHFRFEFDQDKELVYCYELQVADGFRYRGLGRLLVGKLVTIGKYWHMEKILLTVLKGNESARQMYSKVGFVVDPTSPDEHPGVDYEILCKTL